MGNINSRIKNMLTKFGSSNISAAHVMQRNFSK